MALHIVNDDVPEESIDVVRLACHQKDIELIEHDARVFLYQPEAKLEAGELLFRPAVSLRAMRVEQYLYQPGVATFYRQASGIFQSCHDSLAVFNALNIPTPRSFYLNNASREHLNYYVEQVGGFPVVLKVLGHSSGIGVIKIDSAASLYSVADYVIASGQLPVLSAYVHDAEHWRCVVVGDRVVASYLNPKDDNDFRTYGTLEKDDIQPGASPELSDIAVKATHALGYDFGGVDILKHASGRSYVLECNFPCYYAHAQLHGDVDVAGAMLAYLLAKI